MCEDVLPLTQYASWRGAKLKHRYKFTFCFAEIFCFCV